jgi:hypothetical protein
MHGLRNVPRRFKRLAALLLREAFRRVEGDRPMSARQLIEGASFGPETLKVVGEAFDAAWAEIAGNFGSQGRWPRR